MQKFETTILKFGSMGEKTGWTYIIIPADVAQQVKPGNKVSFKIKGKLDNYKFSGLSVLPMGKGDFILALNAEIRKAIGKRHGAMLMVQLEEDKSPFIMNADFMECLNDAPDAVEFFETLSGSHQRYFSKWVDSAKTIETKTKRIALAINALSKKLGYPEMLRSQKQNKL
ncbi:MAG TPA: YdeI/OmpD-associated family protein [Bacteroidia bacterium]|nr:YdeI/OmpD-associated family protein [Bacteroidia bacterium]